jgi:hypothetical protein
VACDGVGFCFGWRGRVGVVRVSTRDDRRRQARERATRATIEHRPEPKPEPRPKSPTEKLEDSLNALREAIREKAEEDAQPLRDQLEDANERLAAALRLADQLGISTAVASIAREMQHWPSWSKPEPTSTYDFSKNLVEGHRYLGGDDSVNTFEMRGTLYRLSLSNEHYGAPIARRRQG